MEGVYFAVWVPNAEHVFVIGDFNNWNTSTHPLSIRRDDSGIWEGFIPGINSLYKEEPALHEKDFHSDGFEWIDYTDYTQSIISYIRKGKKNRDTVIVVCNFTPLTRENYRIGVPSPGIYSELLNSDSNLYGGSNQGNLGRIESESILYNHFSHSVNLRIPPLGILILKLLDFSHK